MKFAFPLPHMLELPGLIQPWMLDVDGSGVTRAAKVADELGFDMVSVPEHLVIPRSHVELSGAFYFHATAAQGYLAGATERIRIGTTLTVLPLHNPVALAKALSTIDWLSGGRITVCFGVGWLPEEFAAAGVPFHERGRIADEYLEAIVALWTQEYASYEGRYVSFHDVACAPRPVQSPHIPIWIGGDSKAALRRAARFGTGWIPFLTTPDELPSRLDYLRSQPGFDPDRPFDVQYSLEGQKIGEGHVPRDDPGSEVGGNVEEIIDSLNRIAELGATVTGAPLPPARDLEELLDHARWFAEEVRPRVD
jgi:probable F420-dependent oxidoreductase